MEIEKKLPPVPMLSPVSPPPGNAGKVPQKMAGALVTPVAAKKRAVRRVSTPASDAADRRLAANKAVAMQAAAAETAAARDATRMKNAIAFDVVQPGSARKRNVPSSEDTLPPSATGIAGIDDRASWLAMVAVPGTVLLRPPQLGKRPLVAASRPVTRAECERRCRQHGTCDPSDKAGCGGVLCGAADVMQRQGDEETN